MAEKVWECPWARQHPLCEACQRLSKPRCLLCGGSGWFATPKGLAACPHYAGARVERLKEALRESQKEALKRERELWEHLERKYAKWAELHERKRICRRLAQALADYAHERALELWRERGTETDDWHAFVGEVSFAGFKDWLDENWERYLEEPKNAEEHPETFSEELVRLEDELGF